MAEQTLTLEQPWEDVGLLRRIWRGRRWYGAEWYITVAGGVLLTLILLMTFLAPVLAPFDPIKTVGGRFTPPGGGKQWLIAEAENEAIQRPEDLAGRKVGVLPDTTGEVLAEELGAEVVYYPSMLKAFQGLTRRRPEVEALIVEPEAAGNFMKTYGRFVRQVGPPFGPTFVLGTDNLGRDILSRIIWGARSVLLVAILSALFSSVVGIPLGLLSGFWGGKLDRVLSLVMDSIYSFPGLILAIAMAAMLGPGVLNIAVAIAVVYIPTYFRIVRGQTLSVKEELYVEAARSLGARARTILWLYVFPNVIPSIVVLFSLNVADSILTEAGLSFLGLGLPPPTPDWGFDLNKGKAYLPNGYWWPITFPGLMITLVALSFSLLGEGLGEILNPRLTES